MRTSAVHRGCNSFIHMFGVMTLYPVSKLQFWALPTFWNETLVISDETQAGWLAAPRSGRQRGGETPVCPHTAPGDKRPQVGLCLIHLRPMARGRDHTFFSSPVHTVLRVSYCDRPLSVVRRRPSSVNFLLKHLLLWNCSLDFDETTQEWSLGGPLPKLFK